MKYHQERKRGNFEVLSCEENCDASSKKTRNSTFQSPKLIFPNLEYVRMCYRVQRKTLKKINLPKKK